MRSNSQPTPLIQHELSKKKETDHALENWNGHHHSGGFPWKALNLMESE